MTELGSALKFETDEPHFVSLGGGRLSIGVTLCPIKRGRLLELALHFINSVKGLNSGVTVDRVVCRSSGCG